MENNLGHPIQGVTFGPFRLLVTERRLANPAYRPPADACALPKAMLVIERAKDVSQPDT